MRPTRRTQPYRKGSRYRLPGRTLRAMKAGRTAGGYNPQDTVRAVQALARKRRRRRHRR